MKSRAPWTAVKMADLDNGCIQDNCEYIYRYQNLMHSKGQSSATKYLKVTPQANQVLVMYVCRRNVVRGVYLWDLGHQRFAPFLRIVCILRSASTSQGF